MLAGGWIWKKRGLWEASILLFHFFGVALFTEAVHEAGLVKLLLLVGARKLGSTDFA